MSQSNSIQKHETSYPSSSDEMDMEGLGWIEMEDDMEEEPVDGNGYSPASDDINLYLRDLQGMLNDSKLSLSQRRQVLGQILSLGGRVSRTSDMNPRRAEMELASIEMEISKIEGKIVGRKEQTARSTDELGFPEEETVDTKSLEEALEKAIEDIESRENLTDEEKIALKSPLEKHLTDLGIAENGEKEIDGEQIHDDIATAKEEADAQDAYAPGVKGLAQAFGLEPEVIKAKAKKSGLDMEHLPSPPTKKVLEFLAELSPELKEQFKKVEDAINERVKSFEKFKSDAELIANSNHASTTDNDSHDLSAWQSLYDIRHYQDKNSKTAMEAMQEVVKTLTPIFQALYPGQEVKAVESQGVSGWKKTEEEYKSADKIKIGSFTLDLFNNVDGKFQASTSADTDPTFDIPAVYYDAEGAGEWSPPALQTYGDAPPQAIQYDEDAGGAGVPW